MSSSEENETQFLKKEVETLKARMEKIELSHAIKLSNFHCSIWGVEKYLHGKVVYLNLYDSYEKWYKSLEGFLENEVPQYNSKYLLDSSTIPLNYVLKLKGKTNEDSTFCIFSSSNCFSWFLFS